MRRDSTQRDGNELVGQSRRAKTWPLMSRGHSTVSVCSPESPQVCLFVHRTRSADWLKIKMQANTMNFRRESLALVVDTHTHTDRQTHAQYHASEFTGPPGHYVHARALGRASREARRASSCQLVSAAAACRCGAISACKRPTHSRMGQEPRARLTTAASRGGITAATKKKRRRRPTTHPSAWARRLGLKRRESRRRLAGSFAF